MKVKDLREKALKKANELEAEARAANHNCLLMPIYQACLAVVRTCDDGLRGRSDKEAEEMADALAAKINLGSK